ncbi:MAG: hypothetical protein O3C52_05530 [Proteobacteria bacterium]|nr:hypothetical protein [Pseudomonadota bacterium]MDA0915580.1 hypothetical protein [Pseudomonadota bacterium]MDA1032815.1 hypothetical protein [Pseudomonadota bacterium]
MAEEPEPDETDFIPANELKAAQIRDIALNGVESLQATSSNMQHNAAAMGRWILASLLAMNSGGIAAALSASDKVVGSLGTPIVALGIGAMLAVLTGVNGLITALRAGPAIGNSIELLRLSVFESAIHASTKREIKKLGPIVRQQIIISSILSAGSLAAFATGILSAVS